MLANELLVLLGAALAHGYSAAVKRETAQPLPRESCLACRVLQAERADQGGGKLATVKREDPNVVPLETEGVAAARNIAAICSRSCYGCIQRYGNRSYHGLLDWRLGLSFLRCLVDPGHLAGLDGHFGSAFELEDWPEIALRNAHAIRALAPRSREVVVSGQLSIPIVLETRHDGTRSGFAVIHPFWDHEAGMDGAFRGLAREFPGVSLRFIDTFEGERRLMAAVNRVAS